MEWIKTEYKRPDPGQKIQMTCKRWEVNWPGDFSDIYIENGSYDEFGNFWDYEGPRFCTPAYWRPYNPDHSKCTLVSECSDELDFENCVNNKFWE